MAFDLDGVLIDSEPVWRDVEEEVADTLGYPYTAELAAAMHGSGVIASGTIIGRHVGDPETGRRAAEMMLGGMIRRALDGTLPAMAGAPELLASLGGRALVAVASNSPRAYVEACLAGAGLGPFDAVVTGDDVDRYKPDPDVYLAVATALGVDPGEVVAIEDSPPGIAAARAAGMRVVALEGLVPLEAGVPLVRSLGELTPERLLAG